MKELNMCYLEKDYLIGPFPYGAACAGFSLPHFLSLADLHSVTPQVIIYVKRAKKA